MDLYANPDYPVIDGFVLDTSLRCNLKFRALAIEQFEPLRRSGAYRSKNWTVPEDSNIAIPQFNSYERQVKVVPGSAIWGFIWTQGSNAGPFSFNVRDACNDVRLLSEVVRADQFSKTGVLAKAPYQQALSRLLVVANQGLLSVEICSQQSTDATGVQLVLCGAEPTCPQ